MDNTALLIVDMQTKFPTAKSTQTIRNCITEIIKAKKANMPIIVLEYDDCGRTLPKLRKHLDSYSQTRYVGKEQDDGGKEVMDCCDENDWVIDTFIVCGVNIGACVARTVRRLMQYQMNIKVVKFACNGNLPTRRQNFNNKRRIYANKLVEIIG